ncbi:hypothetical protein U1Q18_035806 [Sarracenia purpurea var. burkii]
MMEVRELEGFDADLAMGFSDLEADAAYGGLKGGDGRSDGEQGRIGFPDRGKLIEEIVVERTSERSCFSRSRMPYWSFSARATTEPEERAREEKRAESKSWERKAEKIGSEAKESSGDDDENGVLVGVAEDGGVAVADVEVAVLSLKVERRCRGEEVEVTGDLWIVGEAIHESSCLCA